MKIMDINVNVDTSELEKALDSLSDEMDNLSGENNVGLEELFDEAFMKKFTQFSNIEEFFEESDWDVESLEDIEEIPDKLLDSYTMENTKFSSWNHMMNMAGRNWTKKQIE